MTISTGALAVLSGGTVEGNLFFINAGQLDRKLYLEVNEVLENIGGKWNRKEKAHVFDEDPTAKIDDALLTGETVNAKQLYQFYETPKMVAERVIELAEIGQDMCILEPEAGRGALLDALPDSIDRAYVTAVELDASHIPSLEGKAGTIWNQDFLTYPYDGTDIPAFDRIIMNPPFTKQQDIDHVLHAYEMLVDGGRLVAIMSPGFTFRTNKKSVDFRELVDARGFFEELPEGSFKESGTMVRTVIVVLEK